MPLIFPIPAGVPYTICGVWGDPRGGGTRRHQGVDLCCAEGTPLLAVAAGTLNQGPDPLGGTTSTILIADGSHWYYAHESAYAPGPVPRQVAAGDVIGYCGHTGDAQAGVPHLHIGHYVNGAAVDPLPDLQAATHIPLPSPASTSSPAPSRASAVALGALLGLGVVAGGVYLLGRFPLALANPLSRVARTWDVYWRDPTRGDRWELYARGVSRAKAERTARSVTYVLSPRWHGVNAPTKIVEAGTSP